MRLKTHQLSTAVAWMLSFGFRLLFRTLRIHFICDDPAAAPYRQADGHYFIYPIWHDSMAAPIFSGRQKSMVALVGAHTDGSYVSTILKSVGIGSVRGSSSRGGGPALRQLLTETASQHIVLTPDGPRGPRRQLKPGLAFMASRTGKPVVPTAFACTSAWYVQGRWTDLMIPRPLSTLYGLMGTPISVPPAASRQELEQITRQIESEMQRLDRLAHQLVAGEIDLEAAQRLIRAPEAASGSGCGDRAAA